MKRTFGVFLTVLLCALYITQAQAYWVVQNGDIIWKKGDILGASDSDVIIFVARNSTPTPSLTPSITATPSASISPTLGALGATIETNGSTVTNTNTNTNNPNSPPTPTSVQAAVQAAHLSPTPVNQFKTVTTNVGQTYTITLTPTPYVTSGSPTPPPTQVNPFSTLTDLFLQPFQQATPTPVPLVPIIEATPVPLPTLSSTFATQTTTEKKDVYVLKTNDLSAIKIVPQVINVQKTEALVTTTSQTTEGILVSLQSKNGAEVVSEQDELTVKHGNQFVSITNQSEPYASSAVSQSQNQTKTDVSKPHLSINANNIAARSDMAIAVDPLTGILVVDTPLGPQKVSIMPDEAWGIVTTLQALSDKKNSAQLALVTEGGKLVYEITGMKVEKLFGFIPLQVHKDVLVSADTGSIVRVNLPLMSQIISFFTF